jgi:hypothetical protein
MNSCDRKYRDERDLKELLAICHSAFMEKSVPPGESVAELRARYLALIARRAAEDQGGVVK